MKQGKVLVLTVGTGNLDDLEGSLLAPLAKSLADGEWSEAVLLPSTVTERSAEQIRKRFGTWIRVETLPSRNMENDCDGCFGHFDGVLENLVSEGYRADQIVVDFTRGTKAMSAAAVLAAVRREVPVLRYMHGDRDATGTVMAGTEMINEVRPARAMGRRLLDQAANLLRHDDFAAVLDLVPASDRSTAGLKLPIELHPEAARLRRHAEFCAAWDRLDYAEAAQLADGLEPSVATEWVERLTPRPDDSDPEAMGGWLRAVACDLLMNGRRRIRQRHFEDALLRGYRVLELVGQFKLFEHGYDTSRIEPENEAAKRLHLRMRKKGSHGFGRGKGGCWTAGREVAARLLKELGDPLGEQLLELGRRHAHNGLTARNRSILIHGFQTCAPDPSSLEALYNELQEFLRAAEPTFGEMVETVSMTEAACRSYA